MWQTRFEKAGWKLHFSLFPYSLLQISPPPAAPYCLFSKVLTKMAELHMGIKKSISSPQTFKDKLLLLLAKKANFNYPSLLVVMLPPPSPLQIIFSHILSITAYYRCANVHELWNHFHIIFTICCCTSFQLSGTSAPLNFYISSSVTLQTVLSIMSSLALTGSFHVTSPDFSPITAACNSINTFLLFVLIYLHPSFPPFSCFIVSCSNFCRCSELHRSALRLPAYLFLWISCFYLHTPFSASSRPKCPSNSRCMRLPGGDSSFHDNSRLRG